VKPQKKAWAKLDRRVKDWEKTILDLRSRPGVSEGAIRGYRKPGSRNPHKS